MDERGANVDHSTINRWVLKYGPELEEESRERKKPVGSSCRVDETYVKAAKRFFKKSIQFSGVPEKVIIDKSGANKAAAESCKIERRRRKKKKLLIRRIKYLNNIVEQDHRGIKRRIRPMLGFKSFRSATKIIAGIEIMHMIRKGVEGRLTQKQTASRLRQNPKTLPRLLGVTSLAMTSVFH